MSEYTDSMDAADGVRLTVSQVKRVCRSHGLLSEAQDILAEVPAGEDGTYDAQAILYALGY